MSEGGCGRGKTVAGHPEGCWEGKRPLSPTTVASAAVYKL